MSDGEWKLWAVSEFCGVGPDGAIRQADQASGNVHGRVDAGGACRLPAPRNGWLSLRIVVEGRGEFVLSAKAAPPLSVELYREFYHKLDGRDEWHGDALVPVRSGGKLDLPDPDNAVPGQSAQAFWVDVFVPADTPPGERRCRLTLRAGGASQTIDLAVEVLPLAYPDDDCVVVDHNSYGAGHLESQYPQTVGRRRPGPARTAAMLDLIHQYHAAIFEHRGTYHQLGYSQSGATTPLFAPGLSGNGQNRHVSDWALFDRHYGPLLDGSAFAGCRRKARPVYSIYTAFNPAWPADYTGFGQPGYRAEWVNVLRDYDLHLREKGWTQTVVETFFNHKKRYRFFEWDGDEPRFIRDDARFRLYRDFLDEATRGSPVPWRFRCDESWMQKEHWTTLAGVVDFWVNGSFVMMFEKEVHAGPLARKEIAWTYTGNSGIDDASGDMAQVPYKIWMRDFTGNTLWNTTAVGKDPWFASDGGRAASLYPGERFGIAGPIACVRLKILRNAMQDVNLLDLAARRIGKARIQADLIPSIPVELWHETPEGVRTLPPCEWTMSTVKRPFEPGEARQQRLHPLWWEPVRQYARRHAAEVPRG